MKMFAARRLVTSAPRAVSRRALFHSTAPAFVQKGDAIPDLDVLVESSPGNKVNLAKELKGKGVVIGVPAAFSTFVALSLEPLHLTRIQSDMRSTRGEKTNANGLE
jgi:2-Cys peroxiredoxin 5